MPKHARFIAKKEATGPRMRDNKAKGSESAFGRGMFPPRKKKKVKNNKPVARY